MLGGKKHEIKVKFQTFLQKLSSFYLRQLLRTRKEKGGREKKGLSEWHKKATHVMETRGALCPAGGTLFVQVAHKQKFVHILFGRPSPASPGGVASSTPPPPQPKSYHHDELTGCIRLRRDKSPRLPRCAGRVAALLCGGRRVGEPLRAHPRAAGGSG